MAVKDRWCSCTRLREAETRAALWDGVVMCGECKHHYERNVVDWRGEVFDLDHFCELMLDGSGGGDNRVDLDHFCAWGVRRNA